MIKFTVKSIEPVDSMDAKGLRAGDYYLTCARIVSIDMSDDTTFDDCLNAGLTLNYKIDKIQDETAESGEKYVVAVNRENLGAARNYVLLAISAESSEEEPQANLIESAKDFTALYKLPESDAEELNKYLEVLANQRNMRLVNYYNPEREEVCFFFTNVLDQEVMICYLANDEEALFQTVYSILSKNDLLTQLNLHQFMKMFVAGLVQSGEDRYNLIHCDRVLQNVARELSNITHMEGGFFKPVTFADFEKYLNEIKKYAFIEKYVPTENE